MQNMSGLKVLLKNAEAHSATLRKCGPATDKPEIHSTRMPKTRPSIEQVNTLRSF